MYRRLALLVLATATGASGLLAAPAYAARFCVTHDTGQVGRFRGSGFTCVDTDDSNLIDCAGSINGNPAYICK